MVGVLSIQRKIVSFFMIEREGVRIETLDIEGEGARLARGNG